LHNLLCLKKSEVFSPIFKNCFAVSAQASEGHPKEVIAKFASQDKFDDFLGGSVSRKMAYAIGQLIQLFVS